MVFSHPAPPHGLSWRPFNNTSFDACVPRCTYLSTASHEFQEAVDLGL